MIVRYQTGAKINADTESSKIQKDQHIESDQEVVPVTWSEQPKRTETSKDQTTPKTNKSGSQDKTIKVWELSTGKLLNTLEGYYKVEGSASDGIAVEPKLT